MDTSIDDDMLELQLKAAQAELKRAEAEALYSRLLAEQAQRKRQLGLMKPQQSLSASLTVHPSPSTPPVPASSPPSPPSSRAPLAVCIPPALPSPLLRSSAMTRSDAARIESEPKTPLPVITWSDQAAQHDTKRRKADTPSALPQRPLTPPSSESTISQNNSEVDLDVRQPRKHRTSRSKRLSGQIGVGVKVGIKQRREWLLSAHGDKHTPVTHRLLMPPPFYHPDLDELSSSDPAVLQPVQEEWQSQQPSLATWLTEVLTYRHVHLVARSSVTDDCKESECQSDWEQEYQAAVDGGWRGIDAENVMPSSRWSIRMPMPDRLYLELIKALLSPVPMQYLASLHATSPQLHKVIQRQLDEHGRYHLFWSHCNLAPPHRPDVRHVRLIPVLYRVSSACQSLNVTLDDCKRCLPLSQLALLLDSCHSGGAHLKDSHVTIANNFCGVPRKAVRLFAAKCHVCTVVDKKQRNRRPPRAISASEVRQRYTLDLIDLQSWQQLSTGNGRTKRYVAHMIDFSSKRRWAEPLDKKTATAVVCMVRRVFQDFGHPALLHTDNGTEFANSELEAECRNWGVRIIHGRPYHPESQGVIERPNGVLKRALKKYQRSHPAARDWTFVLSQVVPLMNSQVHSVTGMAPALHFDKFNHFSRQVHALPAHEPVVITVAQLATIPALHWVQPVAVVYDDQSEESSSDDEHDDGSDATTDAVQATMEVEPLAEGNMDDAAAAANSESSKPSVSALHVLPIGQLGTFSGAEWNEGLVPQVPAWLRRVGCIANGDCGPASAYYVQHGVAATARQAKQMRADVLAWSQAAAGQLYYAEHAVGELQQIPAPLDDVQQMWARPRCWVTTEFFTCFGGMVGLNVFLLSRCTAVDGTVHAGVRLVTNGGTLIKTDEPNSCCIYFQYKMPGQTGHFEPVRDKQGRYRWRVEDETVEQCLWAAMQRSKVARSVRDMRKKQLTAAHNRVNISNETFQVGDCAWLTAPPKVVSAAVSTLKLTRDKVTASDGKLLVKIAHITTHAASPDESPLPTEHFSVWTETGPIESTFSIDQLQRCHPPPEPSLYRVVTIELPTATKPGPRTKPIKLVKAYKQYLHLQSVRAAVATVHQVEQAVQTASSIDGSFCNDTELAGNLISMASSATVTTTTRATAATTLLPALSMTPPDDDDTAPRQPDPKQMVDMTVSYPCTHCGVTMDPPDCTHCYYSACRAPFHLRGTGCAKENKLFVVDGKLLYCRQGCAVADRSSTDSLTATQQADNAAVAAAPWAQPTTTTEVITDELPTAPSQPVEAVRRRQPAVTTCCSCLMPVVWQKGTGCDKCRGYHHKVRKNTEGCSREGWNMGGSRNIEGSIECVGCRYAGDAQWRRFCEERGGEAT